MSGGLGEDRGDAMGEHAEADDAEGHDVATPAADDDVLTAMRLLRSTVLTGSESFPSAR